MPVIKQYLAENNAQGMSPTRGATAADFGAGIGEALQQTGDALETKAKQDDVANVRMAMAKARADWTVEFQKRATAAPAGDITFADKFNQDFNDYLQKGRDVAYSKDGQRTYDLLAAELGGHFAEKAGMFQAQSVGVKAKQDHQMEINQYASALITDPTQYGSVRAQAEASLNDPNGRYANIPAADRGKLAIEMRDQLAQSYIQGLVDNGAPALARRLLMEGKLDDQLNPDHKQALVRNADVGIRAAESAAEHADLIARRAKQDAQDKAMDSYLNGIVDPKAAGGYPSDRSILQDPTLNAAQKQHLIDYKMRRARELAANHEAKTHPDEVRNLMLQIHAADNDPTKTYNIDPVMESYKAGKVSTAEMVFLRGEVLQMKDGNTQGFQKDVHQATSAVYTAITRSTMGQAQPELAADAAYRFQRDLQTKIEAKRKANEDPRVLLDPGSKEYALAPTRIQSYITPARQAVAGAADAVRKTSGQIGGPPATADMPTSAPAATATYKDFDKLPKGAKFTDPQGNVRVKQ